MALRWRKATPLRKPAMTSTDRSAGSSRRGAGVAASCLLLALCGWFVVASAAAVTAGRAALVEPGYVLMQRYSLLSVLILCCVTLLVLARLQPRGSALPWLVVLLAGVYSVWSFHQFTPAMRKLLDIRVATFNDHRYPVWGYSESLTTATVEEAIGRGLYIPPCRPYPRCDGSKQPGG